MNTPKTKEPFVRKSVQIALEYFGRGRSASAAVHPLKQRHLLGKIGI